MFLILTIITIWGTISFQWSAINQAFPAGDLGVLYPILLSPFAFGLYMLWALFILSRFLLAVVQRLRMKISHRQRNQRRFISWMPILDLALLAVGIILILYGWRDGQLAHLVIGSILTLGLGLHTAEQLMHLYLS